MDNRKNRFYTVEECYQICLENSECVGFITAWGDSEEEMCKTFKPGCRPHDYMPDKRAYYSIDDCTATTTTAPTTITGAADDTMKGTAIDKVYRILYTVKMND